MDLLLNQVQIKPIFEPDMDDAAGYVNPEMEIGHIKGDNCEFGINDKEHIEIVSKLKKSDAFGAGKGDTLDVFEKLNDIKDQIDQEEIDKKKQAKGGHGGVK
jgi:hypothetical protein